MRKPVSSRLSALPWAMLLQTGVLLGKRWMALSEKERARLKALLLQSRGRIGALSTRERLELGRLLRKLDLKGAGPELMTLLRGRGRHKHH